ncbi:MAG: HRDC domain-containing protein [Nocardioidaceae bacterium]
MTSNHDDGQPPEDTRPTAPLLELDGGLPPVVETRAALQAAIESFQAGRGPIALDAERASGYRYSQRAYLIQVRRVGSGTSLIDPVPFGSVPNQSLQPLADAVTDEEWILHAASQDLPCLAEVGMHPTRLFDTELAGRLLNFPRVGLAVLVEEVLGFSMRKEHSAVDWSKRPLPEPWLRYAALDVEMLIELRDQLEAQLEVAGKAQWARQEFEALAGMGPAAARKEPWRRTSGIHHVRGRRGLALVRAMWETRDTIARERDVSSGRILKDAAIVEAAREAPTSRNALGRLGGFSHRNGQRYLKEFSTAVAAALTLPESQLPAVAAIHEGPPPARTWSGRFPAAAARLAACRSALLEVADAHDVPQENLLAPDAVRRLAWQPPTSLTVNSVTAALAATGARPWQIELTSLTLTDALTGGTSAS